MKNFFRLSAFLLLMISSCWADCSFSGNIQSDFKNCFPASGIKTQANVNLKATESKSDFRLMVAELVKRIQIVTSIIAIGVIVWIGLIMVLPVSAEAKESAKAKIVSVVLGFLFMISATIVVNALINIIYEILK